MIISLEKNQKSLSYRILSAFIAFVFMFSMVVPPSSAQMIPQMFSLPAVGTMITMTPEYMPAIIKGLTLYPDNPLMFDFIIDTGDSNLTGEALEDESTKLIKYFLASLTVPDNDQWVNLSPYEGNRIIPEGFGVTEMGRDLLAQDYLLKQLTASLMFPEKDLGSEFWERVYEKAEAQFGTRDIPMNTFNKIWIVPENATVYENEGSAFVVQSHLKVMLEEDYIALNENIDGEKFGMKDLIKGDTKIASGVTSAIVKEILIPEIEYEVNSGETFANLRQIYNSMILATWYKMNLKESLLGQVYFNQNKVKGVDIEDVNQKQKIYDQYVESFKEGVYNYIREEYDPATQQIIPRKYFSGGTQPVSQAQVRENLIKGAPMDLTRAQSQKVQEGLKPNSEATRFVSERVNLAELGPESASANEIASEVRDAKVARAENKDTSMLSRIVIQKTEPFNGRLPAVDIAYLKALFAKYLEGREELRIGETLTPESELSEEEVRENGFRDSREIDDYVESTEITQPITLKVIQMKGGLGSSFKRERTLKRLTGRTEIADKSSDSYFEDVVAEGVDVDGNPTQKTVTVNVAELKTQQYIQLAKDRVFDRIIIQELVNDESKGPVEAFYKNTKYVIDRIDDRLPEDYKRTYAEVIEQTDGIEMSPEMIVQGSLPNILVTSDDIIDHKDATAPGGHGFLGTLVLDRIANNEPTEGENVITTIVNGDGVNNFPTTNIVKWMVGNQIPIVMVSTTRVALDAKGGFFGEERVRDGETSTTLYEMAQAERTGQLDKFARVGLEGESQGKQQFNTNMSLENDTVLHPFLKELKELIGEEKFFAAITPTLISNPKTKSIEGEIQEVFQLEGAKGAALLNLNKYVTTTRDAGVRELMTKHGFIDEYGQPKLVYVVNFAPEVGTDVFTPEKFAYDHGVYALSDLFKVNVNTGRLEGIAGRDRLPGFELDSYYKDVENVIDAWGKHISMDGLESLKVQGKVHFADAKLRGKVRIINETDDIIDLNEYKAELGVAETEVLDLSNVVVIIDSNKKITSYASTDSSMLGEKEFIIDNQRLNTAKTAQEVDSVLSKYRDVFGDVHVTILSQIGSRKKDEIANRPIGSAGLSSNSLSSLSNDIVNSNTISQVENVLESLVGNNSIEAIVLKNLARARISRLEEQAAEDVALRADDTFDYSRRIESPQVQEDGPVGGIDLNPALLDLQIKRDGKGVPLSIDVQDFENMNIRGFMPVIINITPILNLPLMLGFAEEDTYDEYASADSTLDGFTAVTSRKFWMKEFAV
ncbi:MAG: UTP--glucose-1-phosphate uridylyltransferase [Candidatus Omnitrophica bacterium]|nr:UTP--glucose-1-phosphate uridylyltransferase [Candidatus Omnitrophota bacterium]